MTSQVIFMGAVTLLTLAIALPTATSSIVASKLIGPKYEPFKPESVPTPAADKEESAKEEQPAPAPSCDCGNHHPHFHPAFPRPHHFHSFEDQSKGSLDHQHPYDEDHSVPQSWRPDPHFDDSMPFIIMTFIAPAPAPAENPQVETKASVASAESEDQKKDDSAVENRLLFKRSLRR
ncbi:uncharacterized protein LOC111052923 [Nilaparvata lugens]|uniref:uncharacterized protein LOC111052923 n=1 Tax=Nilaparvata lugens TaxID=108931 RepID=UPI00193D8789|nr:uncharacterized protein LOC111052923 [Nilaparvata lugens]